MESTECLAANGQSKARLGLAGFEYAAIVIVNPRSYGYLSVSGASAVTVDAKPSIVRLLSQSCTVFRSRSA